MYSSFKRHASSLKLRALTLPFVCACLVLLILGCSDLMLFRADSEYLPLVDGSEWKYLLAGDTTSVAVAGDSLISGRTCIVVLLDDSSTFWLKERSAVYRYCYRTVLLGGGEYQLEKRFGLIYLLPLVTGNAWQDVFEDTVVVLGTDTVPVYHKLAAKVASVEPVTTPAGVFEQCYRLDFTEEIRDLDTVLTSYSEWLAPGVGVVKRQSGADEQALAWYRIGP